MKKFVKKSIEDILALTPMQEGMLVYYLKNPGIGHYFEQLSLEILGEIDVECFEQAWNFVIERNEMLRTFFHWEKMKAPSQIVLKEYCLTPVYLDLSNKKGRQKEHALEEVKKNDCQQNFDLRDVPFRVTLCKVDEGKFVMILSNHHILYDGWSNGIILREFFRAYNDSYRGKDLLKIPAKTKFKEYVKWIQAQDSSRQKKYWNDYLTGIDTGTIFFIKKRKGEGVQGIENYQFTFSEEMGERLQVFVKKYKVTTASLLYSAWGILLQKYTNTNGVLFGTTVSGRSAKIKDIENIVGLFINTLPLRVESHPEETIIDLLARTNETLQQRAAFEWTSLVDIKGYSDVPGNEELFNTIVVIENYPLDRVLATVDSHLSFQSYSMVETTSYDLTAVISIFDGIEVSFKYRDEWFDGETIEALSTYFIRIIENFITYPETGLNRIDILTEEEKNQILFDFNDTKADYPADRMIHQLFEEQVERTGHKIALVGYSYHVGTNGRFIDTTSTINNMSVTYNELKKKSNQLAQELMKKGVRSDTIVGIMMERTLELIIGILGILKAGGAYLPIDPDYPVERMHYMLSDSNAGILLSTQNLSEKIAFEKEIIYLENYENPVTRNSQLATSPGNLAYIIYTSGTTGKPKGVMIDHRSLVNRLTWMQKKYPIDTRDTLLQKTPFTFDVSVWEILWWAMTGAKGCLLPAGGEKNPEMITDVVEMNNVTVLHFVPSMLTVFLEYLKEKGDAARLACLKQVISSGEALTLSQVKQFDEILYRKNATKLANLYGPTEATIDVSYYNCFGEDDLEIVPIGKPINNLRLYVVDKQLHLQPVGVAGELVIAGDGLARGYLNKPELTAEKFNMSYKSYRTYISYRTGDLARWLPDGNIEFLGRMDHQVKIRGFRIELGEIESQLLNHEKIDEAVVITKEDGEGDKYLCAYVVARNMALGAWEDIAVELREYLKRSLPDYMVPSYFVPLEKMPLTANGKIDRKALPEPGIGERGNVHVTPRDAIETSLAEIWAEVLGVERDAIGIDSRFFEVGGHSLKAFRLVSMIHKKLDVKIPLAMFFKMPSIRELSRYIKEAAKDPYISIIEAEKREYYPLSDAQKRLYISQHLELKSVGYNIQKVAQLEGRFSLHRLEETFRKLMERHESLRTSFEIIEDEPVQKIHKDVEFNIKYYSNEHGAGSKAGLEVEQIIQDFIKPFDLSLPPLLRVGLIDTGEEKYILMLSMHHIISDVISMNIIFNEFTSLYRGDPLPVLRLQYKDFSLWQNKNNRNPVEMDALKQQEAYWLREFEGEIPMLNLPVDYARPAIQAFEGAIFPFELDEETRRLLKKIAREEDATLFMVLVSIIHILLSKICDQEDILLGTPVAGRRHPDLEPVIGFFVNMLVLRNRPSGGKTFREFLREVKEKTLRAFENQDYPFEDLVDKLSQSRDSSRHSLFDVAFAWENMEHQGGYKYSCDEGIRIGDLQLKPCYNKITIAPFDIVFWGADSGNKLYFLINFRTSLFKKETIKTIVRNFNEVLSEVLKNQDMKLEDIASSHDLLLAVSHSSLEDQGDFGWD
jgi:tyrocidine synthetase-3